MTALHPPSFHRNDFSTCSTHYSFWGKQQSLDVDFTHAHAQADNAPFTHAHVYGVVQCLPVKSPTIYRRNLRREKNDRLMSVHTSIDYGNVWCKISARACSGKEIAGLQRKMIMMMNIYDDEYL